MSEEYLPTPADLFTFGLWTVGNVGRDPFGNETRPPLDPVESVQRLAELGAYGVNFHDDDLSRPARRPRSATDPHALPARARRHRHEGADGDHQSVLEPGVQGRRLHRQRPRGASLRAAKTLDAIDLGVELGATVYVMWGGREGAECDAAKDVRGALDCYAEAVNICCAYITEQGYDRASRSSRSRTSRAATSCCRPSATRSRSSTRLEYPEMVGLNPEFAHETMSGLSFHHAVAQALWADKLFHIDLNGQVPGKYDQDFRFGSEGVNDAFYL